jgi:hypothetical protein
MTATVPAVSRAALWLAALLLAAAAGLAAQKPANLQLASGARVGVVNLLDAEVTHFHAARQVQDSFLKTYPVNWAVNAMLLGAVEDGLTQRGLKAVPVAASDELSRARENCFLNATLAKGLPRECAAPFARLAAAEHLEAIIVLGPGLNTAAHAGASRHRELPEYLRGWCFVSGAGQPHGAPQLLSLTELLLIGVGPAGAQIADREWGGDGHSWTDYPAPADLKAIPAQQLDQLRPLFGAMLKQQAGALLGHLQAAR